MTAPAPLAGVRVIDFCLYLPGPYCTRVLADLGAEVVKVEPLRGDPIRAFMPGAYEQLNRGKQAVALDLKDPEGLAAAHELVAGADVVLEGFRPGVAHRLGVGFETCAALRPGIVYASLSGYGQSGPDRDHPGHDIGYEASGGAFAAALAAGDALAAPPVAVGDLGGALFAATTISAHLVSRAREEAVTEAVHLDVALQEAVVHLSAPRWAAALRDGGEVRVEALANFAPGMGLFRTADDRWVALASVEDKFWAGLCAALGAPELAAAPYDEHVARMRARAALRDALTARIAERTLDELTAALRAHDVPLDAVRDADAVLADEHLRARGIFRAVDGGLHVDFPVRQGAVRSFASDAVPSTSEAVAP
jgi:crotonobetainyl-CoA:carnitine CoA-transferase CaiB-like acyl-CoA transferase